MIKLPTPLKVNLTITRVSKVLGEAIFFVCLLSLLALAYGTLPNRWYHVLSVYGGSMVPTFSPGDMIVITPPPSIIEPGMVLTLEVDGNLVTHRLVKVNSDGSLVTKGDKNSAVDDWGQNPVRVVGQYRFAIPYLGQLVNLKNVFKTAFTGAWFITSKSVAFSVETGATPKPIGTSLDARLTATGYHLNESGRSGVRGEICLENTGAVTTENLIVTGQVEINDQDGSGFQPQVGGSFSVENLDQIGAGETRCFPFDYPIEPVESAAYRLAMTAQITNHSGWLTGGPHCPGDDLCQFGPTVREGFDVPISQVDPELTGVPSPSPEETQTPTPEGIPTGEPTQPPPTEPSPTEEQIETPEPTIEPSISPVSNQDPETTPTEEIPPTETPDP